jgi:hypothetical protein
MKNGLIWSVAILLAALVIGAVLKSTGAPGLLVKAVTIVGVGAVLTIGKQILVV